MNLSEIIGVTLNVSILAVFYTALGGLLSYGLYQFVEQHDQDWESKPVWYQLLDVSVQLAIVGIVAFWVTYNIKEASPIFPVSKKMDEMVDTYISGIFFAYAMFLFIEYLDSKIQFLYDKFIGDTFALRKMEKNKKKDMEHQDGV